MSNAPAPLPGTCVVCGGVLDEDGCCTGPPRTTGVWGHKVTAHIYVAGDPTDGEMDRIAEAICGVVPGAMVSLRVEGIRVQPAAEGGVA